MLKIVKQTPTYAIAVGPSAGHPLAQLAQMLLRKLAGI
jgi:hypothetical protein